MSPVRLEPATPRSPVKHSTTGPRGALMDQMFVNNSFFSGGGGGGGLWWPFCSAEQNRLGFLSESIMRNICL